MKKSTLLISFILMAGSALPQVAKLPVSARDGECSQVNISRRMIADGVDSKSNHGNAADHGMRKSSMRMVAPPSADDKIIDTVPEGEMALYSKEGVNYGYSWLTGLIAQKMYTGLSNVVTSSDGKKMYIQNPVFFFFQAEKNWIEGDVDGDELVIHLPQHINHEEYNKEVYDDYLLKLEFVVENEEEQTGWYYPCEDQTYRFKIMEDGSLVSLDKDYMLGVCNWSEAEEPGGQGDWSWQGNGDFIYDMGEVREKAPEVPEDVAFEEWQILINNGIATRTVKVGIEGDRMYVVGLFSEMKDSVVTGVIADGKVSFDNAQYLGEYWSNCTLAYFLTGDNVMEGDGEDAYSYFQISDNLVFDYDAGHKILSSDGAYCISCAPDKVLYYAMIDNPYIFVPTSEFTVERLIDPIITKFYDVDEEYGSDAEIYFNFPIVDANHNLLDTANLYYEVILDGEPMTLYNDTYNFPEGIEEITEIPFDFEDESIWVEDPDYEDGGYWIWSKICGGAVSHSIQLADVRDFGTLGIRTLYRDGDNEVYSDIVWCPNYAPGNGVDGTVADVKVSEVRYYDLLGKRVERPGSGMFVRQTVYEDGSVKAIKVVRK